MIKGKRGRYQGSPSYPYNVGDWVMVHTNKEIQVVGQVQNASKLGCTVKFYKTELWTEVESGFERMDITSIEHSVPITSIACTIPEEVAKNLLLLQGVEL